MIKNTFLALLVVVVVVVVGAGCGGDDAQPLGCTQIGCSSGMQIAARLALTSEQIQTSALSVCRNGAGCVGSDLRTVTLPQPGQTVQLTFSAPTVGGQLSHLASGFLLQVDYGARAEELHDGDSYDLTLRAPDGTTLLAVHQAVTYRVSTPNGTRCGPLCVQAYITR